jgi:hypothetical protein
MFSLCEMLPAHLVLLPTAGAGTSHRIISPNLLNHKFKNSVSFDSLWMEPAGAGGYASRAETDFSNSIARSLARISGGNPVTKSVGRRPDISCFCFVIRLARKLDWVCAAAEAGKEKMVRLRKPH